MSSCVSCWLATARLSHPGVASCYRARESVGNAHQPSLHIPAPQEREDELGGARCPRWDSESPSSRGASRISPHVEPCDGHRPPPRTRVLTRPCLFASDSTRRLGAKGSAVPPPLAVSFPAPSVCACGRSDPHPQDLRPSPRKMAASPGGVCHSRAGTLARPSSRTVGRPGGLACMRVVRLCPCPRL